MTTEEFEHKLEHLIAYKKEREALGRIIIQHDFMTTAIELANSASRVSHQSCWCIEQAFLIDQDYCLPHINQLAILFTQPINSSGMRSLTKIASIVAKQFYSKKAYPIQGSFQPASREMMVEGCFRVLIEHQDKTANLAFATRALYEFGKEFHWINESLKALVEQILDNNPETGYRAVGRQTLAKLSA